jgi:hypothetical protein
MIPLEDDEGGIKIEGSCGAPPLSSFGTTHKDVRVWNGDFVWNEKEGEGTMNDETIRRVLQMNRAVRKFFLMVNPSVDRPYICDRLLVFLGLLSGEGCELLKLNLMVIL